MSEVSTQFGPIFDEVDDVRTFLRRYVILTEDQCLIVALYVLHTHCFDAAAATPYISVTSPAMRSGKSRLLEILALIVREPLQVSSISPAALYHAINELRPTLLFDEVDAAGVSRQLRAVINDGYKRGGTVMRLIRGMPVRFSTFCPKVFAGIGRPLPPTIMDRSISIRLNRRAPEEEIERFRRIDAELDAELLRLRLSRLAEANLDHLGDVRPALPDELNDRAAEVFEPLVAIADLTGHGEEARQAAIRLMSTEPEPDPGAQLLIDTYTAFATTNARAMASRELLGALQSLDDPALESGYRGVEAADLARLLRAFGITPSPLRFGGHQLRGYRREQFSDAWHRYVGV